MDCSPTGSSVHWTLQARILEWVAISPGDIPDPVIEPVSLTFPWLAGRLFTANATWEAIVFDETTKGTLIMSSLSSEACHSFFFFFHLFLLVGG